MSFDEHKPARIERDASGAPPIPVEPEAPVSHRRQSCPECGRPMQEGSVLCVACGHDQRSAASRTHAEIADATPENPRPCPHCGYDLRGLRAFRCPECGKVLKGRQARRDHDALIAQGLDYKKPLIMIGAAAVVMTLAVALIERSWDDMARLWITLGAGWLVGLVVYAGYGLIWLGFESPWRLIALRLGAAYLCTEGLLLGQGTIMFLPGVAILMAACYAALLWDLFDLDIPDAFILSILTLGVQTGIRLWIKAYM
ncbi:MAG: zinc ribbon domain-containing protein [Planctomycetota bacterium]